MDKHPRASQKLNPAVEGRYLEHLASIHQIWQLEGRSLGGKTCMVDHSARPKMGKKCARVREIL
jgi:hypothetical protein